MVGLYIYPESLALVADREEIARHVRRFERHLTVYEWQHYLPLIGPDFDLGDLCVAYAVRVPLDAAAKEVPFA